MSDFLSKLSTEQAAFKEEILEEREKYKAFLLDMAAPEIETQYLFSIDGVNTIPQGELIGLTGRKKSGKSQFAYLLVSVMLAKRTIAKIRPLLDRYKVLLFDTEQSINDLRKCCKRALKTANYPTDKNSTEFLPFFLRPVDREEKMKIIESAIAEEKPNVVFIDGIRDLVKDFNDIDSSDTVIQWLLRLTAEYGCTIFCTLHQNKSAQDSNLRGHLGTELANKLTDLFEVSKGNDCFSVKCTDSRHLQCPDIAFSLHDDKYQEAAYITARNFDKIAEIQSVLNMCFKRKDSFGFNELRKVYSEEGCVSTSTAASKIKIAKEAGYLKLNSEGKYYIGQYKP